MSSTFRISEMDSISAMPSPASPASTRHQALPSIGQALQKTEDEVLLNQIGYEQQFKRKMGTFGVVGISFTAIGILTGASSSLQTALFAGGPLGIFWGWNVVSLFMFLIALSLAEICSAFPTAGGLYYWVCRMRPQTKWLGFVTGNVYALAMVFTATSGNLSTALYLASIIEIALGKTFKPVEIAAMAWAICVVSGCINAMGSKTISRLSAFSVFWTLGGTLVLVICLLVKAPVKNTGDFVFFQFENFTGWSNTGFVVLLGFVQAVYTLEGCETAAQVAEEAVNAAWLAPVGVAVSVLGSWFIGLIYLLSLLFSIQSIARIQETSFSIPIAQLYFDAMGKKLTILCLVVIMIAQYSAAITAYTASSRLYFALARDRAFPGQRLFMDLNRFDVPWAGIVLSVIISCALCAAYIGSTVAFNAILSSAAISVLLAYGMPVLCRVFWPSSLDGVRGPFHLGKFSWAINFASLLFIFLMSILFVMPTAYPVSAVNMNYAVVAIGGLIAIVMALYIFWGRHVYEGVVHTYHGDLAAESEGFVGGNPTGVEESAMKDDFLERKR